LAQIPLGTSWTEAELLGVSGEGQERHHGIREGTLEAGHGEAREALGAVQPVFGLHGIHGQGNASFLLPAVTLRDQGEDAPHHLRLAKAQAPLGFRQLRKLEERRANLVSLTGKGRAKQ
jgi:hypothetical protein